MKKIFKINKTDNKYLFIEVDAIGEVVIKRETEGIVVDVYSLIPGTTSEPITSCWCTDEELKETE